MHTEGTIFTHYSPANNYLAIRFYGDSMANSGILDGAVLIIQKQSSFSGGNIVMAILNNKRIAIMRYKTMGNQNFLMSDDKTSNILVVDDNIQLVGIVIEVRNKLL